jgi:mannose-1-phosphate guanylyltransferase
MGVEATAPNSDYGWIVAGRGVAPGVRAVDAFAEKPPPDRALALWRAGALWNTMVVVARAWALWELFGRLLPRLAKVFEVAATLGPGAREAFLAGAYDRLEPRDFSRDILGRAGSLAVVAWPADLGWTDLGTPDRLQRWLEETSVRRDAFEVGGARS